MQERKTDQLTGAQHGPSLSPTPPVYQLRTQKCHQGTEPIHCLDTGAQPLDNCAHIHLQEGRRISRDLRLNERIRAPQVRLIGENGEQLGIVALGTALSVAREQGLDLVEVAATAVPPVCRLLDYGRFKYEQEKKEREARKNQKVILLKEVRLRPKTDEHDIDFKTHAIERFIEEGDKVKVTIRFRGRELVHPDIGRHLLEEVASRLKDVAIIERAPLFEGNAMSMILAKGKPPPPPQARPGASEEAPPAPQPAAAVPATPRPTR